MTSIGYFGASDVQTIRIRIFFWGNWDLEAVEAAEVAEATDINEAAEVFKALKITKEDTRVIQVLEFKNLRILFWCFVKKSFDRIIKTHVEF